MFQNFNPSIKCTFPFNTDPYLPGSIGIFQIPDSHCMAPTLFFRIRTFIRCLRYGFGSCSVPCLGIFAVILTFLKIWRRMNCNFSMQNKMCPFSAALFFLKKRNRFLCSDGKSKPVRISKNIGTVPIHNTDRRHLKKNNLQKLFIQLPVPYFSQRPALK
jgi:hypothetical protein